MFQRLDMRRRVGAPEAVGQQPAAAPGWPELDNRLKVRERLFTFDDFWIENARSQPAFLHGKALRVRDTLRLQGIRPGEPRSSGEFACTRDTMTLYNVNANAGEAVTTV
jgi:uncharacterized protein YxjI